MLKYLFFSLLTIVLFTAVNCKKDPPVVPPVEKPQLGKRNYIWTIDTLAYPGSYQTLMSDIWASSSSDVYVVGHNDRGYGKMYHFDGKNWKAVDLTVATNFGAITLTSIYGFSANDIYAVGDESISNPQPPFNFVDSSLILHFDGTEWKEVILKDRKRKLISIYGSAPSDVWAGGLFGSLYHFDGSQWQSIEIPDSFHIASIITNNLFETYLGANTYHSLQTEEHWYFLKYTDKSLSIIQSYHSNEGDPPFGLQLYFFNNQIYSTGPYLFKYSSTKWQVIKKEYATSFTAMSAPSDSNIFLAGIYDVVWHYNGDDWYQYPKFFFTPVHYNSVWTDGNEVFIVGQTTDMPMTTVILHGK